MESDRLVYERPMSPEELEVRRLRNIIELERRHERGNRYERPSAFASLPDSWIDPDDFDITPEQSAD